MAGGLEVALACDLIVAARGARLGIPEVKRSLVAAGGALLRLPRALPRNVAMELALTGDPIDAERAYELGLVNRLADPGQALSKPRSSWPRRSRPTDRSALAATKRIMVESADWPDDGVLRAPAADHRPGLRLRGRARGRHRVRRAPRPDLAGAVSEPQTVAMTGASPGSRRWR